MARQAQPAPMRDELTSEDIVVPELTGNAQQTQVARNPMPGREISGLCAVSIRCHALA